MRKLYKYSKPYNLIDRSEFGDQFFTFPGVDRGLGVRGPENNIHFGAAHPPKFYPIEYRSWGLRFNFPIQALNSRILYEN